MLRRVIKKLVARYQRKQLAKAKKSRAKHNWEQAQLMYKALGEREY